MFKEEAHKDKDGRAVACRACGDPVLGPSYLLRPVFQIIHSPQVMCRAPIPRDMHHPIHRKHPLVLYCNYTCDICRKTLYIDLFAYRCEPCKFELHLQCASDLSNIKYLEPLSHEHALIIEDDRRREEVCRGCMESVLGPRYRCSPILCRYYLHKSCAEMPLEFHHPIRPKHPLILNEAGAKQYLCDACGHEDCSGKFTYSCFQCDLNFHPQCTFTYPNIKHFSHVHLLMFNQGEQKHEDGAAATVACPPVVCSACGDPIHGPSYSCNQCSKLFILHKSCGDLRPKMHHPIHNEHPLVLLSDRNYCCDICRRSHSGLFSYRCSPCNYELDIQCASDLSNIKYIEHFSHKHALIFVEDPEKREGYSPVVYKGCGERILDHSYCCSQFRCHYTLHKSCAELLREMHHPIHNKHPLVLLPNRNYHCDICRKSRSGLFSCWENECYDSTSCEQSNQRI
ncbi:hypothetical protein ACLB2K_062334 [Fragaria x ananassa]